MLIGCLGTQMTAIYASGYTFRMSESHSTEQRKRSIKPYILLAVITIVFICLLAFTLANTQSVHISFIVAETDTSLILALLVSAGLGLVLGILGTALLRHRHHRHHKQR